MKVIHRILILLLFVSGCSVIPPLQRSNLIAVFHLIEISNYEEAKTVIEDMIMDAESREWSRTWYARGLLTQTAVLVYDG
jgi:DTW domain-containing protein YfiP